MLRFFWSLILCLLVVTQTVAEKNLTLSDIPTCSLQCLVTGFELSGCGLLDTKCQCASEILFDTTSRCVLSNCSKSDGIELSKYQAQLCQKKNQSRQGEILGFVYGGLAFSLGSAVVRFASRWVVHGKVFLDDYMVMGAIALVLGLTGTSTLMVTSGFGQHVYQIETSKISEILFLVWFSEGMYVLFLVLIKLALVLFFLRIFPQRWFKICCHILLVLIAALGLMWILLLIFQCHPVKDNWDIYTTKMQCIDVQAVAYAGAGINIAQDIAIMILPIPLLLQVRVTTSRKLALLSMFSVGIFVIATSCARLGSISTFANSADATFDDVSITIWTTLEIDVALFCCNMPSISALISRVKRKNKETKNSTNKKNSSPSTSQGTGPSFASSLPSSTNKSLPRIPERTMEREKKPITRRFSLFPFSSRAAERPLSNSDDMTLELVNETSITSAPRQEFITSVEGRIQEGEIYNEPSWNPFEGARQNYTSKVTVGETVDRNRDLESGRLGRKMSLRGVRR